MTSKRRGSKEKKVPFSSLIKFHSHLLYIFHFDQSISIVWEKECADDANLPRDHKFQLLWHHYITLCICAAWKIVTILCYMSFMYVRTLDKWVEKKKEEENRWMEIALRHFHIWCWTVMGSSVNEAQFMISVDVGGLKNCFVCFTWRKLFAYDFKNYEKSRKISNYMLND